MLRIDLDRGIGLMDVPDGEHTQLLRPQPGTDCDDYDTVCFHLRPIGNVELLGFLDDPLNGILFHRGPAFLVLLGDMRGILSLELHDSLIVEIREELREKTQILVESGILDTVLPAETDENVDVFGSDLSGIIGRYEPFAPEVMENRTYLPESSGSGPHCRMSYVPLFGRKVLVDAFAERISAHINSTCERNARHGDLPCSRAHIFRVQSE